MSDKNSKIENTVLTAEGLTKSIGLLNTFLVKVSRLAEFPQEAFKRGEAVAINVLMETAAENKSQAAGLKAVIEHLSGVLENLNGAAGSIEETGPKEGNLKDENPVANEKQSSNTDLTDDSKSAKKTTESSEEKPYVSKIAAS